MLLGKNETTKRSGIKLGAANRDDSRKRQQTLRKYSSWFMFLTSILLTMLFSFLQVTFIHQDLVGETAMLIVPYAFLLVVLVGTLLFAVKVGTTGRNSAADSHDQLDDFNEDDYWKGGLFYFNKSDPSIFVEKRFGVGWTLNFANPKGYLVIFGPLILIWLLTYYG